MLVRKARKKRPCNVFGHLHRHLRCACLMLIVGLLSASILPMAVKVRAAESRQLLKLIIISPYHIKLEWKDVVTGEKGFKIERAVDSGQFATIAITGANATSYTDYRVSPGYVYTYRVLVIDKDNSVRSYTNEVSTSSDMVTGPDSLILTPLSADQIELAWTYPGYKQYDTVIERKEGTKGEWNVVARVPMGIYKYIDTGLSPGTKYFYRIKGATSSDIYSTNYPNDYGKAVYTTLEKPFGLYGYAITHSQIFLVWEYNGEANYFFIERKINDGDFITVGIILSGNKWFHDKGLSKGTFYTYRIKAVKGGSESAYSEEITINCTYLNPPVALSANTISGSIIELKWDNSGLDIGTEVEIWRKSGYDGNWELYEILERNHNRFIDRNIDEGISYSYKLRSVLSYSKVYSNFSNTVNTSVYPYVPPDNLDYAVINENKIQLMWNDNNNDESGFKIEKKIGTSGEWNEIAYLPPNTETYYLDGLSPENVYFFRVRAFNDITGLSAYSDEIKVTTRVPATPSGLEIEPLSSRRVRLTWIGSPTYETVGETVNEAGFIVERKLDGQESYKVIAKLDPTTNSYIDTGLLPSRRYIYRIKAYNKAGSSNYTVEKHAVTKRRVFFQDIPPLHPAREAIEELAERGIIIGKTGEYFDPDGLISKAEFTSFIVRAFKLEGRKVGSFNDVIYGDEFYDEIMVAKNLGIVTGDPNNNFYPDKPLTRVEMAVIIDRVLKAVNKALPEDIIEILDTYIDRDIIPNYTKPVFAFLVSEKAFYLKESYMLLPKESVTRAEAAMAIYRIIDR
ncbi:MAG: fibronectin type III domain-containing protein [Firmicutes bacterium]|nr:fibronectin type III domain-containing protein [Bacillota bacterium]